MVTYKICKFGWDEGQICKSLEKAREEKAKKQTRKGYATFGIYRYSKSAKKWIRFE